VSAPEKRPRFNTGILPRFLKTEGGRYGYKEDFAVYTRDRSHIFFDEQYACSTD
jgi:hypothetical protein